MSTANSSTTAERRASKGCLSGLVLCMSKTLEVEGAR